MARIAAAKPTEFKLYAPVAKKVSLAGSFNKWDSKALSAKKDSQGNWTVKVSLKPGKYEYKFFVDGSWTNDPRCNSYVTNSFGTQNCVLEVK
jgi:1,4-alpha-glucan branching enzyme